MKMYRIRSRVRITVTTMVISIALGSTLPAIAADDGDLTELWSIVRAQQARIAALETALAAAENRAGETARKLEVAEERLDSAGELLDTFQREPAGDTTPAAGRSSFGGYGELHYNNLDADDSARDVEEIDFHRFVLFFDHEFDERVRFYSELEVEHALVKDTGDGSGKGEVELEQAYLEFDLGDRYTARTGLFLVPVGILNETHEPPTFYGVERNDVENIIIPTTWWEAGFGVNGRYDNGISWDLSVHSGLAMPTAGDSAFRVRSGRQKVAEAPARDLAYTGRVRYTGIPGLELSASLHYESDASQADGDGLEDGLLFESHLAYQRGPWGLKALYARWDFDGSAISAAGVDEQDGWYVEPSYRFSVPHGALGLYARYENLDGARTRDRFEQWEVGFNYYPTPQVALKFDFRDRDHDLAADRGRDFRGIDLGVGYYF